MMIIYLKKMKKENFKFLIRFLILFVVVEILLMMRWIIFSGNPITWGEFLRDLPFSILILLLVVFFRGFLFMSPPNKKGK
jgi:hypothetical protein